MFFFVAFLDRLDFLLKETKDEKGVFF